MAWLEKHGIWILCLLASAVRTAGDQVAKTDLHSNVTAKEDLHNAVALVNAEELRIPQPVGKAFTTTKQPVVEKQHDLQELINREVKAERVEFSDKYVNFRSKKIVGALNFKRKEVIEQLKEHGKILVKKSNHTKAQRVILINAVNATIKTVNDTFQTWLKASKQLQTVLEANYTSVESVVSFHKLQSMESQKQLEQLQIQAVREAGKIKAIAANEKQLEDALKREKDKAALQGKSDGRLGKQVDAVLEFVGDKANDLRKHLEEPAFLNAQKDLGANLLTVVKLSENELQGRKTQGGVADGKVRTCTCSMMPHVLPS